LSRTSAARARSVDDKHAARTRHSPPGCYLEWCAAGDGDVAGRGCCRARRVRAPDASNGGSFRRRSPCAPVTSRVRAS
jgi:hypothetical protein